MRGIAASTIAACFALAAFAVAVVAGLASGNPAASVLGRAIAAMVICYPAGLAVGYVAQRVISEHIEAHKEAHPAPDSGDGAGGEVSVGDESGDEEVIIV
jgi:hypothetical protein